jgi:hypothetical protein
VAGGNLDKKTTIGDILDLINGDVNVSSTGASTFGSGVIVDADINASAAIALTKLAIDPLDRSNHTGTQLKSTISDFAHTHPLSEISDVSITATNLNILDDGLDTTLHFHASDRSRANHTGTQAFTTITGTVPIAQGGSGETTQQAAIDALTNVSAATDEHVLTKDTATGNAVFKAASGEANTISSIGGGTANLVATIPKLGVDLRTKTLSVTAPVNLTDSTDILTIGLNALTKSDLPASIAYEDEANNFGTNIQTLTRLHLVEQTTPSPPPANTIELYAFDRVGRSVLRYINPMGNEFQLAQDNIVVARNQEQGNLTKGQVVYISGAQGSNRPQIALAQANSESTMPAAGILAEDISNNSDGFVIFSGQLEGLDTSSFIENDILYVSHTVAGALTTTKPTLPDNFPQVMARVINAHASQGRLLIIQTSMRGNQEGTNAVDFDIGSTNDSGAKSITLHNDLGSTQLIANPTGVRAITFPDSTGTLALTTHAHVLTDVTDVTITATNLNILDNGTDTTLHFHASDRARANHTGTQLLSTISDVTITAANLNILDDGADTTLHFHSSDRARANHTGTQLLSTISDVTITATNLNILDDGADTTLHFHAADRARANHTGTQLLSTISDVTITATNLNILDDGVNTTLHFHDSDRARANHTGTQALSTIVAFPISKGGTVLDPAATARNIIAWRAPFSCTVTNVRGYRTGGSAASINARRNGSSNHLASNLSLGTPDVWADGGAVQNTAYVAGDKLEIMIISTAGSPTEVAIQVDYTRG